MDMSQTVTAVVALARARAAECRRVGRDTNEPGVYALGAEWQETPVTRADGIGNGATVIIIGRCLPDHLTARIAEIAGCVVAGLAASEDGDIHPDSITDEHVWDSAERLVADVHTAEDAAALAARCELTPLTAVCVAMAAAALYRRDPAIASRYIAGISARCMNLLTAPAAAPAPGEA